MYSFPGIYPSLPPFHAGGAYASRVTLPPVGTGSVYASRGSWCLGGWVGLGGRVGLVDYMVQRRVVVERPPCRSLACWPASEDAMGGEGALEVCQGLVYRDKAVHLGDQLLTSWSNQCRWFLCLRELLVPHWMVEFGTCRLQGTMGGVLEQPAHRSLADWPISETTMSGGSIFVSAFYLKSYVILLSWCNSICVRTKVYLLSCYYWMLFLGNVNFLLSNIFEIFVYFLFSMFS